MILGIIAFVFVILVLAFNAYVSYFYENKE